MTTVRLNPNILMLDHMRIWMEKEKGEWLVNFVMVVHLEICVISVMDVDIVLTNVLVVTFTLENSRWIPMV